MQLDVAIVGGGISGLAAAFEIGRRRPDWSLAVLEREASAGGKVRSSARQGFTVDWGPDGFLSNAPHTLAMVEALGLGAELRPAAPAASRRYLYHDGGLRPVPFTPPAAVTTELLSPLGKLRAALEPLQGRHVDHEETVFDFIARHFGQEAARMVAGPMVLGVTAGDARRLSLDALFPTLRRLEAEHGSLVRAMIANRRPGAEPARLTSFVEGGMGRLSAALADALGERLRLSCAVRELRRLPQGGFELLTGGDAVVAERVAITAPAFEAARLLEPLLPQAALALRAIPYPAVDVFGLGFDRIDVPHALDGFGFLVPRGQGIRSLGVVWSSSIFPERAPGGKVLLRVMAGGAMDPDFSSLPDDEALAVVRRDLQATLGVVAQPLLVERVRWERGIPQYELGHRQRVAQALAATRELGRLALGGNAYFGVGVNDCVRDAQRLADELTGS